MGIKGIYKEIGPGQRIALSKLAVETYEREGRPLRLAIDTSIWLFQIQAGKGGSNPALRTFYYRLLRLISLSIHPLFVFDGPNKPPFKRNKRTGPNVSSIPEFLAKQLLRSFGFPTHLAPGEAEAECALLQKKGVVDAVLSEDVDTLMFGSGLTIRNWTPEGTAKNKVPTHVNLYDAQKTREGSSGLDSHGMILVAIMSGGDYIPEGIPGCGPKTACEAARAGFGGDLCKTSRRDSTAVQQWKDKLCHELKTNESKFFKSKHQALVIPDDFPRLDILKYYTQPCVSTDEGIEKLRRGLKWDMEINVQELRSFAGDAFDWTCLSGAKKFIRNLAPALLVKELRMRADRPQSEDLSLVAQEEGRLIKSIHKLRNHITTDGTTELQVGFIPVEMVNIDLDAELPDPETTDMQLDSDDEVPDLAEDQDGEPGSPRRKRGPSTFDPTKLQKHWVFETFVKVGVPLKSQDWGESFRNIRKYEAMKAANREAAKLKVKRSKTGGMRSGALDPFARVTKPSSSPARARPKSTTPDPSQLLASQPPSATQPASSANLFAPFRAPPPLPPSPPPTQAAEIIELLSSPLQPSVVPQKRSFRRSHSDTTAMTRTEQEISPREERANSSEDLCLSAIPELPESVSTRRRRSPLRRSLSASTAVPGNIERLASLKPSPIQSRLSRTPSKSKDSGTTPPTPCSKNRTKPTTPSKHPDIITISSSPATPQSAQKSITNWFRPSVEPPTPSPIRKKSAIRQDTLRNVPQSKTYPMTNAEFRQPLGVSASTPNRRISFEDRFKVPFDHIPFLDATGDVFNDAQLPSSTMTNSLHVRAATSRTQKEFISLRDSLPGTWRRGDASAASNGKSLLSEKSPRKHGQSKPNKRTWRVSEVQVLDLTEL